ncbi:MAG: hypothetical protein M1819_002125 [Sarea resinae]|nr:MAG: hypothetical protein M1819_002125 [Sarea resinae]
MASGAFTDPRKLLRLAPIITTTASLYYAWDQHFFLTVFTQPPLCTTLAPTTHQVLPAYFTNFFNTGIFFILGINAATITTAITNLFVDRRALNDAGSLKWYAAGLALTMAHFAFVPAITGPVGNLVALEKSRKESAEKGEREPEEAGKTSMAYLHQWLKIHRVRALTVDLAGWTSFLIAVLKTVTV